MPPLQEPQISEPTTKSSVLPGSSETPPLAQQHGAAESDEVATSGTIDPKTGKRRFLGPGSRNLDAERSAGTMEAQQGGMLPQTEAAIKDMKQPDLRPQPIPISPSKPRYPQGIAASPSRLRSSSPRLHSPASSEAIFERNVQEPVPMSTLHNELDPAHIPSHVMTEDHIPPALEASAQAITSEELNPDEVEIVTSSSHQPAMASVLEGSTSHADLTALHSPALQQTRTEDSVSAADIAGSPSLHQSGILPPASAEQDDAASTYGQLDPNDVKRLSFISFADVIQHEHHEHMASHLGEVGSRDSMHMASLSSSIPSNAPERTTSPFRSPRSPASNHSYTLSGGTGSAPGVVTPPQGTNIENPLVASGSQGSPARSISGGTMGSPAGQHGELTIETMRQAVRKTASGDLAAVRNAHQHPGVGSPISDESLSVREPRSRTNT
ncbi:hypothetical protein KC343_g5844 [Hortaea werneckii]|uniref:Uncharacterized protein n=1 Tax=Hortaea werneckii TaxID=91943 RepID=A0A3M7FHV6_HORWE|nr:hypothetical protein KC338_g7628 [Hortaea werneckii]KAI6861362.1 hypothetical protein KC323_g5887 [Hortaea werneckii]KAI7163818.1 hypothetical protein KC352_g26423 [Hortaea werneckii]KAI7568483.1 hypothetical protein KC317_g4153 [Hortaea werneckii]KAI7617182.1 hypothetical protein KC346_g5623 [Hortaea werneckii]